MNMGKVVPVRVLERTKDDRDFWMGDEFRVRYTGTEKVCLDWGVYGQRLGVAGGKVLTGG
jgi:hypothetical protein